MNKGKKSLQDKIKEAFPEFYEELLLKSEAELNDRIAQLAKDSESVQDAKEADEGLAEAQAKSTELGAPYREAKSAIKLKIKYIIQILKNEA